MTDALSPAATAAATTATAAAGPFRVDRFAVPRAALAPFLERVRRSQRLLYEQPGCLQNLVLSRDDGTQADVDVVTIVEWADEPAMRAARATVQARYAAEGFDPAAFMRGLGVQADMVSYLPV
ncbi:MAG: antibiotic biosynthesis monooxygenase [Burkholderiaceae bacterium]